MQAPDPLSLCFTAASLPWENQRNTNSHQSDPASNVTALIFKFISSLCSPHHCFPPQFFLEAPPCLWKDLCTLLSSPCQMSVLSALVTHPELGLPIDTPPPIVILVLF